MFLLEITMAGLGAGGLYALTGLAFVIIYKATRVVNLAIGDLLMAGTYLFFAFSAAMGLARWESVPAALLGAVVGKTMIRPMLGKSPISSFMVTIGLSSILVVLVELIWTADQRCLPQFLPTALIMLGEAFLPSEIFYGFWIAVTLIVVVRLAFRFWRGGVALRATASDQAAPNAMDSLPIRRWVD